ncbi:MAG TPA: hypothetical protein PLB02_01995 [Thermoanaerobaculia bacterium]|nr:hypothetical protein [Thermoanaerobaculia bacterium]HQR66141.1 hypothetical protein [Thermoanaerobaculia bacterium]
MIRCRLLVALVFFVFTTTSRAEVNPNQYPPASLQGTHKDECKEFRENNYTIDGRFIKLTAPVLYAGTIRPISGPAQEFVKGWAKVYGQSAEIAALYTTEIQVREDKRDYWVPFQKGLLESLRSELPKGGLVKLYLVYGGCTRSDPVFLATEFENLIPPH